MSKNSHSTEITSLSLPAHHLGNPLNFVEEFFDHGTLPQTLSTLHDHFIAIFNTKQKKKLLKRGGSNELFTVQMLIKFVEAMWLIWMEDKEQSKGTVPADFQASSYLFDLPFFSREKERDPWLCVPCHLTQQEFFTPMLAVDAFFNRKPLHKWKRLLDEIIHNLLSTTVPDFGGAYTNPYEIHFYLAALIESAFLIHVRQQEFYLTYLRNLQNNTNGLQSFSQSNDNSTHTADIIPPNEPTAEAP